MISEQAKARFAKEVAKYPNEQKQSAVLALLAIVQQEQGWVSKEAELEVATYLGMAPIAVHEVTTFYNMYNLERKLGIAMGGTTADGLFTLQQSECLGACADSPVLLVNDRTMCSFMSNEKLDQLVDGLKGTA